MPRPRAHEVGSKRESALVAATELLLARDHDGMSLDTVAASAGVSKTTVCAHFSDKLSLFQARLGHVIG